MKRLLSIVVMSIVFMCFFIESDAVFGIGEDISYSEQEEFKNKSDGLAPKEITGDSDWEVYYPEIEAQVEEQLSILASMNKEQVEQLIETYKEEIDYSISDIADSMSNSSVLWPCDDGTMATVKTLSNWLSVMEGCGEFQGIEEYSADMTDSVITFDLLVKYAHSVDQGISVYVRFVYDINNDVSLLDWRLQYGDYEFFINELGAVTISNWSGEDEILVIPREIDGLPVTGIGEHAFAHNDFLTSIEIPESVTEIYGSAFCDCAWLISIKVSPANENYEVKDNVLIEKKSKTLTCYPAGLVDDEYIIPDGIAIIGKCAFIQCERLERIVVPESVTEIGEHAFSGCYNLMSIDIPETVIKIGYFAFFQCYSLASIDIPESVTEIGGNAFAACDSLTSIVIPASVTKIGGCAFCGCDNLTSIEIPKSVTEIGLCTFAECISLTNIEIPESVTKIGNSAFSSCESLTSIEIPPSVTEIGEYAFGDCYSLTSIEIPDSVAEMGDDAFSGCEQLTMIVVRDSYAAQYAEEQGIQYIFTDVNDSY